MSSPSPAVRLSPRATTSGPGRPAGGASRAATTEPAPGAAAGAADSTASSGAPPQPARTIPDRTARTSRTLTPTVPVIT